MEMLTGGDGVLLTRRYVKMLGLFLVVISITLAVYLLWSRPSTQNANLQKYQNAVQTYEAAMQADTYGGKTPEETLQMFITALEKGDVDLASKYFLLEQNSNDPNYLTRKKWEGQLEIAKSENRIQAIIDTLREAKRDSSNQTTEDSAKFQVVTNGNLDAYIEMRRNNYSGVWKIESL